MLFSVVIATYKTRDEHLDALVQSLQAQTLPPDQFEVIFADDGSGEPTLARLHDIAARNPNMRVLELENSGWACRPRNEGTGAATGDYVLFMDHDDTLFPQALERVAAFAAQGDFDIINPREVRTHHWSWAWDVFDSPDIQSAPRVMQLMPMTPHKFYRRSFLAQHGIEFIAERRVLWEDVFFNVACVAAGARVGILRDYPVYHWVTHKTNTSSGFGRNREEVWAALAHLIDTFDKTLPAAERDALTLHWLRTRVLDIGGRRILKASPQRRDIDLEKAAAIVRTVDDGLIARLDTLHKERALVLRQPDPDLARLYALAELEDGIAPKTTLTEARWKNGALHLHVETTFHFRDVELQLRHREDGGIDVRLPYALGDDGDASWMPLDLPAGDDGLAVTVRGRHDRQSWPVATAPLAVRTDADGSVHLVGQVTAEWDIGAFRRRVPNWSQPWDIAVRASFPLRTTHRPLHTSAAFGIPRNAVLEGTSAVAYRNADGGLTVDLGGSVKNAIVPKHAAAVRVPLGQGPTVVSLPLDGSSVKADGPTPIPARLHDLDQPGYDTSVTASLVPTTEAVSVQVPVPTDTHTRRRVEVLFARSWVRVGDVQVGARAWDRARRPLGRLKKWLMARLGR